MIVTWSDAYPSHYLTRLDLRLQGSLGCESLMSPGAGQAAASLKPRSFFTTPPSPPALQNWLLACARLLLLMMIPMHWGS